MMEAMTGSNSEAKGEVEGGTEVVPKGHGAGGGGGGGGAAAAWNGRGGRCMFQLL